MKQRHLLLVSTSTVHGTGYLDHCEAKARELFEPDHDLLFLPFALHDREAYAQRAEARFAAMGLRLRSLHREPDPRRAVQEADGFFTGGGNTFRLVAALHDLDLVGVLRERVLDGAPYMGTSAGSNIAAPTLCTTNDMPIVQPLSFMTLGVVTFQINPHYIDPDANSTHMGETRDQRLAEFHEEHATPVVGLREGVMLEVEGETVTLRGEPGGKLFLPGQEPAELEPDSRLPVL